LKADAPDSEAWRELLDLIDGAKERSVMVHDERVMNAALMEPRLQAGVDGCEDLARKNEPLLYGAIELTFTLQPSGARSVALAENSVGNEVLSSCLQELFEQWSFPPVFDEYVDTLSFYFTDPAPKDRRELEALREDLTQLSASHQQTFLISCLVP